MQIIITKYRGATNHKGARIIVSTSGGKIKKTVSWDYELDADANHREAAKSMAAMLQWDGEWFQGDDGKSGYVFVSGQSDSFTVPKLER